MKKSEVGSSKLGVRPKAESRKRKAVVKPEEEHSAPPTGGPHSEINKSDPTRAGEHPKRRSPLEPLKKQSTAKNPKSLTWKYITTRN